MAAEIDTESYSDYQHSAADVSMRTTTRRTSPNASPEDTVLDRDALFKWLNSVDSLLTVWHEHFAANANRPIRGAEIAMFSSRLVEVNDGIKAHLYSKGSLLSTLGYANRVGTWKSEIAEPWSGLMDAVNIYRNATRRIDPDNLRDPAEVMSYEEVYFMKSKKIRQLFSQYREELAGQVNAIQDLLLRGK